MSESSISSTQENVCLTAESQLTTSNGCMTLLCILDFERSRSQKQGSEFSSQIGFNMGKCMSKV